MRRRIYWLLPDLASAHRTMDDLLLARIAESHIHFVGREDMDLSGLHAAVGHPTAASASPLNAR